MQSRFHVRNIPLTESSFQALVLEYRSSPLDRWVPFDIVSVDTFLSSHSAREELWEAAFDLERQGYRLISHGPMTLIQELESV